MGCGASKQHSGLSQVDDSMHVMMKHDKKVAKKKGEHEVVGYVPRAEHPLLNQPREEEKTMEAPEAAGEQ